MKRIIGLVFTLMFVVVIGSGCGDSREGLAEEAMSAMKDMVATLDTVKDEASAKAAKSDLQEIASRLEDLNKRQEKLPEPTDDEMKALIDKHGKEMDELTRKLTGHMLRIAFDPKIQAVLGDVDFRAIK